MSLNEYPRTILQVWYPCSRWYYPKCCCLRCIPNVYSPPPFWLLNTKLLRFKCLWSINLIEFAHGTPRFQELIQVIRASKQRWNIPWEAPQVSRPTSPPTPASGTPTGTPLGTVPSQRAILTVQQSWIAVKERCQVFEGSTNGTVTVIGNQMPSITRCNHEQSVINHENSLHQLALPFVVMVYWRFNHHQEAGMALP